MEGGADTFLRPAWMSSLLNQATAWKGQLPVEPKTLQFDPRDPLARYFAREIQSGIKLLRLVKKHLNELIDVCEGKTDILMIKYIFYNGESKHNLFQEKPNKLMKHVHFVILLPSS